MAKNPDSDPKQIYTKKIRKMGGSFGVILPKSCVEFGFLETTKVVIVMKPREIKIVPADDVNI